LKQVKLLWLSLYCYGGLASVGIGDQFNNAEEIITAENYNSKEEFEK
jgi:hypothetical protein